MQALLMKDYYVLFKQMKLIILITVIFTLFNREFGSIFLPVWSSMLPYTSISYDEQSKWDQLANMMPYSVRDLVLEKYLLGWLCMGAMTVFVLVMQGILSLTGLFGTVITPVTVLVGFSCGVCILALSLPAMFWFGVERGRLFMFAFIFAVCMTTGAASFLLEEITFHFLLLIIPLLAVVLSAASVPVSMKLYAKRHQ